MQNEAQRTFSLLFPLCRLGRSAQVSCAVRSPICDLISTGGSVFKSTACSFVWFSVFLGVRTICPTPKRRKLVCTWYECAEYRGKERGWWGGVVRACVGVGGRENKNIFEQKATKMSTCSTSMSSNVQSQVTTWHVFQTCRVISLPIVTAHNFFVLHNNHPFNHGLSKACSQCRTKRSALFLSCFLCVGWVVLHKFHVPFVVQFVISSLRMDQSLNRPHVHLYDSQCFWG